MNTTKRFIEKMLLLVILSFSFLGQNMSMQAQSDSSSPAAVNVQPPSPEDVDRLFSNEADSSDDDATSDSMGQDGPDGSLLDSEALLSEMDTISVDFPNEEIRTVLRNVADLYMLNLVVPETLQGTTSIKLRDVSWRQIFKVVLDPVGYTYTEKGNIIEVVSKEALNFEPPITDIFLLNYADANSIANTIRSMIDETAGGRVQVDSRTNGLIVTERESKMDNIRTVVERLDKPTEQVLIEARFIEVTNRDIKNIGVNWAGLRDFGVNAGPFRREYSEGFNRSGTTSSTTDNNNDTNLGDVSFDIFGAELDGDPGDFSGRLVDNLTGQVLLDASSTASSSVITSAINNLSSLVDGDTLSRNASAVFSTSQFGFILSALKEQDDSRLVSHPTVVTLNNQEAVISVGEQFPIPDYTYNEERGTFEISGFQYKDIGVILRVKPSVNNQGLINLKINPEVSNQTGETTFGGASGAAIPIISTRRTETQIALNDGYTMGLGGLLQTRELDKGSQVPVLGKIPGLGRLFRHDSTDLTTLNLLVFITAKILPGEEATFEDVFS